MKIKEVVPIVGVLSGITSFAMMLSTCGDGKNLNYTELNDQLDQMDRYEGNLLKYFLLPTIEENDYLKIGDHTVVAKRIVPDSVKNDGGIMVYAPEIKFDVYKNDKFERSYTVDVSKQRSLTIKDILGDY